MPALASTDRENAIGATFGRAAWWGLSLSAAIAVALELVLPAEPLAYVSGALLAGVGVTSVVVALRYYNWWLTWLSWLIPMLPIATILEPLRQGHIAIASLLHAYAIGGVLLFGVFIVARKHLRSWIG